MELVDKKIKNYLKDKNKLFSEWKEKDNHKGEAFITDGVVNPKVYFSQEERILFMLKEAYDDDGKGFSLTRFLRKERPSIDSMWKRVSEWTKLIVTLLDGVDEVEAFKRNSDIKGYGNEFLQRIAVINVKKSDGKRTSESENLAEYVENDKKELLRQLEICDPMIIVCGNVGDYLKVIIEQIGEELVAFSQVEKEHYVYHFTLNGHDVCVISYWHPANQFPDLLNYYGFANICKIAFGIK